MIAELAVILHVSPTEIEALDERMTYTLVEVLRKQYEE